MRRPPPLSNVMKYPVVGITIALATVVTLASWSGKVDVTPLFETIDIRRGQLWRLVTSALPHGDILHLVFNLYWTWVFGTLIEEIFGHLKTLAIFLLLAVIANGAEYAILSGGIGLSGIVYGLFGLLWVLSRRDQKFAEVIDQKTAGLFVVWFFFCIFLTVSGTPIANIAHGMGAVAGAILGWTVSAPSRRFAGSAALTVLLAATLVGSTLARPWINLSTYRGYDEAKLGYDDLMANRNAEALQWYRDAVRMQPKMASFWFNIGIAYDRVNQHSNAMAAYKQAHDLEPSNATYQAAAQISPG
jgi:membrane associated rhomboid family serine protease